MRLFGEKLLDRFAIKHPQFRHQIAAFKAILTAAAWKGQHEIPSAFSTAQKGNRVLFRVGQSCRIITEIEYVTETAFLNAKKLQQPLEQIGSIIIHNAWTHEEYNRHQSNWWK